MENSGIDGLEIDALTFDVIKGADSSSIAKTAQNGILLLLGISGFLLRRFF
jgi:hypothetical protein